jgi:hypothetical protein
MTDLRKKWIPLIKIAYPSVADVIADWFFYDSVSKDPDPEVQEYKIYLFVFFIVSAVMGVLTILGLLCMGCYPGSIKQQRLNKLLGLEILLGDVPQLVLASLVAHRRNSITATTAFSLATSGYNFILDALEMIAVPEPEVVEPEVVVLNP